MNNDRTLFSRLAHAYESAVVHLLAQHEVPGLTPAVLRAFQESYASTAFRCRFPHCERLSLGFATAELRLEHETIHVRRLYCQTISCQYNRIGFAKRSALNAHIRKHHGQPNTLLIPARVRRTIDVVNTQGDAITETRSPPNAHEPQLPQQSAAERAQQKRQHELVINAFAKRLMDSAKSEIVQKFQDDVDRWPENKKQLLLNHGISPLFFRFRQHAEMLYGRGALNSLPKVNAGAQNDTPHQIAAKELPGEGTVVNAMAEPQTEGILLSPSPLPNDSEGKHRLRSLSPSEAYGQTLSADNNTTPDVSIFENFRHQIHADIQIAQQL
jgi:hypothetical protein